MKTLTFKLLLFVCLCLAVSSVMAQDIQTRGSINGAVKDKNGAAIVGATVKVTGQTGERTVTSNEQGLFAVENLLPGNYTVRVESQNFKSAEVSDVTVYVGKSSTTNVVLEPGAISEIVTVIAGPAIDSASTAVGSNLNDQLFQNIPVQRSVSSLFYIAPGATDSLGGGKDNPSIAGGSALDNLYVADGVNITDSAFGGLGTFTRSYGSLGTGINTSFIKEVQIKTGGFEPQYGQSEGGIVQIVTQSGGNDLHGALYGYARPNAFEAKRKQRDDFAVNKVGEILASENYDAGFDLGGPIVKDKLFFFGSFNPTIRRDIGQGALGSNLLTLLGDQAQRYRTLNYAGKIDYNINSNHTLAFSIFGDPSKTNVSSFRSLNIDNTTAMSRLDYGTRSIAVRYNGTFGPKTTLSASFSRGDNHFDETGFANFNNIFDRTQPARGNFTSIGLGFVEPTKGKTYRTSLDATRTARLWGSHTLGIGYQFQRGYYSGNRDRSGPKFTIPSQNAIGVSLADIVGPSGAAQAAGQTMNAAFSLRVNNDCELCPTLNIPGVGPSKVLLRVDRAEFGEPIFNTYNNYNAAYVQDTWRVNKYVTAVLGLRTEQERLVGNPGSSGKRIGYSFTDQWAPRLGVTVDPFGKGNTKVFYNFGRFFEYLPLDLAERSLSSEKDFTLARFIPQFHFDGGGNPIADLNEFGVVIPVVDAAHFVTNTPGAGGTGQASVSAQDPSNPILPGTKLGFAQEHIIGFEQQLPRNFVLSVRYQDRRLKRIVEDAAVVAPEDASFFGQTYFIGNITSKTDAAVNPISHVFTPTFDEDGNITNAPAVCSPHLVTEVDDPHTNALLGAVCYEANGKNGQPAGNSGADGVPDGFVDPVHIYKALEIEINKRFSNNWQLLSNWRIASLRGNYEGHFRNDNGQTDPGISSLFDFTAGDFNLLGDQFKVGPLNTDRRHIINVFTSYQFSKGKLGSFGDRLGGLTIGPAVHFETGVPISQLLAHPVYANAGEVPVGGRGSEGRTPSNFRFDLHTDYPYRFNERMKLSVIADFFNIFNTQTIRLKNQNAESTLGQPNPDFLQPTLFYLPFNMRLGLRFEF
jgi:Carboxypeptidase regulatory-like domain